MPVRDGIGAFRAMRYHLSISQGHHRAHAIGAPLDHFVRGADLLQRERFNRQVLQFPRGHPVREIRVCGSVGLGRR